LASKGDSVAPVIAVCLSLVGPLEYIAPVGNGSLRAGYAAEQHHLGPPLRSHLCNLVLLI
jgi:hypothetical protein